MKTLQFTAHIENNAQLHLTVGHGRILSTDKRDFHTYRWKNTQPFSNLLSP